METSYLADHEHFLPTLAAWQHREWGHLRTGDTLDARTGRLRAACTRGRVPTVFIAHSGGELFGSAMLVTQDMETRPDFSPWLAGVFVAPAHRGRGIASALIERAVEEARRLGVPRLHLFTATAEPLYARLGWTVCERTRYRGEEVTVMALGLTTSDPAP